jgi:hypothetical protein
MPFALLALLAAAQPAQPAQADAIAPPAEAMEVARATMPRATWDGFRDQAAPALGAQLEKETAANALALKLPGQAVVIKLWDEALPYEEFLRFYATSLAEGLSPGELAEVAAFHRSAAGKRFLSVQRRVEADAQRWIQDRLPRLGAALNRNKDTFVGPARSPEPKR